MLRCWVAELSLSARANTVRPPLDVVDPEIAWVKAQVEVEASKATFEAPGAPSDNNRLLSRWMGTITT